MELESVVLALLLAVAGALYFVLVDRPRRKQLQDAQRLKQKVAEQQSERAAGAKKASKPKPKRVDVTAEKKRKGAQPEGADAAAPEHAANLHVLAGHKYALTCAAYSPNGRFVATASTDRTVRVYAREALRDKHAKPHVITTEYDHVTAMTFSCDGKTLVIVTEGGQLKMYRTWTASPQGVSGNVRGTDGRAVAGCCCRVAAEKLRVKPELVAEFPVAHKTDVHSVLMNDIGNVRLACLVLMGWEWWRWC